MTRKILTNISIFLTTLLISCSPHADYIGKTYAPTTNVDIYMDLNEIKKDYEIMGEIKVQEDLFAGGTAKLQEKLIEEAKMKGADAVFIEGLDEVVVNTTSTTQGAVKDDKKGTYYNEQTQTKENKRKLLNAKLLKYKK